MKNKATQDGTLVLPSTLHPDMLLGELSKHQPWGHKIDFSNGVSTAQLERRVPFSEFPIRKLRKVSTHIPFERLRGGRLLDIGCNSGHNSIHAAVEYGLRTVGIDVTERHMQVARFLAELAGVECEFMLEDAETFLRPEALDVVLHFGTLYHLPNPLLSLQNSYANLKPGGYLALETQTYDHPEYPDACYFMHMQNNDPTNFWAISEHVLRRYLQLLGYESVDTLSRVAPARLPQHQYRTLLVARKPA